MKKIIKITSAFLTAAVLMISVSAAPFHALTLYVDGAYTFADLDNDHVALYAFDNSSETLTIPADYNGKPVSSVYNYAFEDNAAITSLDFSQASRFFSTIGMKSFVNCTGLTGTLSLPTSITSIGHAAFEGCTGITELQLNASVVTIPTQCFNKCSLLRSVQISPFTEEIDHLAFANCPNLRDVYLSAAVTSISDTAFKNSGRVKLYVFYDSYARVYAQERGMSYVLRDAVCLGDVDDDGNVSISDVTLIQRHLAELEQLEGIFLYAADTNKNGVVDISDATAVQMHLAEYDVPYPIGELLTQ